MERRHNRATTPPIAAVFSTQVVGVTHYNYPDLLNEVREVMARKYDQAADPPYETQFLELTREPDNEHDANAVIVCWNKQQLGYLNSIISFRLAPELDAGATWLCRVEEVEGPDDQPGISIRMKRSEA